jgi:hypothetical protein
MAPDGESGNMAAFLRPASEPVQRRGVVDQDAVAGRFLRRPFEREVEGPPVRGRASAGNPERARDRRLSGAAGSPSHAQPARAHGSVRRSRAAESVTGGRSWNATTLGSCVRHAAVQRDALGVVAAPDPCDRGSPRGSAADRSSPGPAAGQSCRRAMSRSRRRRGPTSFRSANRNVATALIQAWGARPPAATARADVGRSARSAGRVVTAPLGAGRPGPPGRSDELELVAVAASIAEPPRTGRRRAP